MIQHIAEFFASLLGTQLPQAITLSITFALVMWLFKAILGVFGATKTHVYDKITIMGVAYILLQSLADTLAFSVNFGGVA